MKKYQVTFYYHTNCVVEVEAENVIQALNLAERKLGSEECNEQIMEGLQEDSSPDVEEI